MHSNELEDIQGAGAGDIVAFFGVECASGDTFTDGSVKCAPADSSKAVSTQAEVHMSEPCVSVSLKGAKFFVVNGLSTAYLALSPRPGTRL